MNTRTMEQAVLAEILDELRSNRANSTEYFARLHSSITNDVLASGLAKFDSNGLITDSFRAPYGSIAVFNHGSGDVVLTSSAPGSGGTPTAPQLGKGVHRIPAGTAKVCNLAGTVFTLYGTAGEFCTLEVFTKPQPPTGAGAGKLTAAGQLLVAGLSSDADASANAVLAALLTVDHAYGYNGTTWDRLRTLGAAGDGLGVLLTSQPSSAAFNDISGAGAAVTRTFNAVAGQRHRLTHVSCSYSAAASTGTGLLTVTDGATVIAGWDVPLAVNTPFAPPLPEGGLVGSVNTNLVITLAAGAAGTVGRLNTAKLTT